MICQECNKRPATLHFTKIINGEKERSFTFVRNVLKKKVNYICSIDTSGFSINNLLAGLFNIDPSIQQHQDPFEKQEVLQCDHCSMTFKQFLKVGKFGCCTLLYSI